jgi:hypothetical protein
MLKFLVSVRLQAKSPSDILRIAVWEKPAACGGPMFSAASRADRHRNYCPKADGDCHNQNRHRAFGATPCGSAYPIENCHHSVHGLSRWGFRAATGGCF